MGHYHQDLEMRAMASKIPPQNARQIAEWLLIS
jgi:hypothetical protein